MFIVGCGAPQPTPWTGDVDEEAFTRLHHLSDREAPPPRGEDIVLDGARAYLSLPDGPPPHPAVIVIHEWWGLNDHIRHWADRLAAAGYAALAVDLYGGEVAETPERAMELMRAADASEAVRTLRAAA